jgi:hypothetical protein
MRPGAAATLGRLARGVWRSERGEVVSGVLLAAAAILVFLGGISTGLSVVARERLNQCISDVVTASRSLQARYAVDAVVPQDDPDVLIIQGCKQLARDTARDPALIGVSGPAKNLSNLVDQGLEHVGKCTIAAVTPADPEAGITAGLFVDADIPLAGPTTTVTATTHVGGAQFVGSMGGATLGCCHGTIGVPLAASANAAGEASEVVVTARAIVTPGPTGCIPPSTLEGGQCVLACSTPPFNVVWKKARLPEINAFTLQPSTIDLSGPPVPAIIVAWDVSGAKSVTITHVGKVADKGSSLESAPDKDTDYTLTAVGARPEDTKTVTRTLKVIDNRQLAVTLTSPSGNSTVTNTSVGVTGKVTPAPSTAGSMTGTISVNGVAVGPVTIDGGGNFTGSAQLQKVMTLASLTLTNPSPTIQVCGNQARTVTVGTNASQADVTNVVTVTVTDGTRQGSASATVFHAVRLNTFQGEWQGCVGDNPNVSLGATLGGGGQPVSVGQLTCGCTQAPLGCHVACAVKATVGTSVGTKESTATWTLDVTGPCP